MIQVGLYIIGSRFFSTVYKFMVNTWRTVNVLYRIFLFIVVQTHILESSRVGRVGAVAVLEFWLQVLTKQNIWHRDKTALFLLDHLCRAAFLHHQEECLHKLLYQQHKVKHVIPICV